MVTNDINDELLFAAAQASLGELLRTAECPDESEYWSFLDDEHIAMHPLHRHFISCAFCRKQLADVAIIVNKVLVEARGEESSSPEMKLESIPGPKAIVLRCIHQAVQLLQNPYPLVPSYRAEKTEAIAISEQTPKGEVVVEFLTGKQDGYVEIILSATTFKNHKKPVKVELWKEGVLLRSIPLSLIAKQSLSQWPRGNYILILSIEQINFSQFEIALL